jgi:hypothetical protein
MTERRFIISHRVVRVVAFFTLLDVTLGSIADRYYPTYGRIIANSWAGAMLGYWVISASLLLPLYVGFEAWWMRKSKEALKGVWFDALLALACFFSLVAVVLYAWSRYAMF